MKKKVARVEILGHEVWGSVVQYSDLILTWKQGMLLHHDNIYRDTNSNPVPVTHCHASIRSSIVTNKYTDYYEARKGSVVIMLPKIFVTFPPVVNPEIFRVARSNYLWGAVQAPKNLWWNLCWIAWYNVMHKPCITAKVSVLSVLQPSFSGIANHISGNSKVQR